MTNPMDLLKIVGYDFLRVVIEGYSALLQAPVTLFVPKGGHSTVRLDSITFDSYVTEFCKRFQLTTESSLWCNRHHQRVIQDSFSSATPRPLWVSCWMGLLNFLVPVVVDNRAIAVLYGGQFMLHDNVDRVRRYLESIDIQFPGEVTQLDQALKCMHLIKHEEASLILERANALSAQLSDVVHRLSLRSNAATLTIAEYLERSRLTTVLVLGKDTGPELVLLHEISKILEQCGYSPILAKDLANLLEMSSEDKLRNLADASRFVILENSFPTGQIAERKILSTNRIVTAFLRQESRGSSFMVTDYSIDFGFMSEFTYKENDKTALIRAVEAAAAWAEKEIGKRRNFFNAAYPWRTQKS